MTRLVFSLSAFAFAVSFNACEQHSVAALPEHYRHKMGDHHEAAKSAESHAKPEAEQPSAASGEKKAH